MGEIQQAADAVPAVELLVAAALTHPERRARALEVLRGERTLMDDYLAAGDMAARLGICVRTLRRDGAPVGFTAGGKLWYRVDDVIRFYLQRNDTGRRRKAPKRAA